MPPVTMKSGRGERIRTSGLYVPNVALYQTKLHPEICKFYDRPFESYLILAVAQRLQRICQVRV